VVIPGHGAAGVTPAVCRASAGAVEHLRVARVRNLADYLGAAKAAGAWVYGAEAGGGQDYTEPDYGGRVVLVVGSEGRGLRPRVGASCDAIVSLPLRGKIASLNVSAATTVLLYEVLRQRGDGART
jgi:23S rRNA (guanosine2251-2'-O)-methyltransferase